MGTGMGTVEEAEGGVAQQRLAEMSRSLCSPLLSKWSGQWILLSCPACHATHAPCLPCAFLHHAPLSCSATRMPMLQAGRSAAQSPSCSCTTDGRRRVSHRGEPQEAVSQPSLAELTLVPCISITDGSSERLPHERPWWCRATYES